MEELFNRVRQERGFPQDIDVSSYATILDVFTDSVNKYADLPAFSCMGHTLSYADIELMSREFAAYLQNHTSLKPGDRIAVQLPNVLQYHIVVFGAMRAGMIVVNTNPLYTEREMEHQFNDSGAKALVIIANMAHMAEKVVAKTSIKYVVVTEIADLHPPLKRTLINLAVKYVKKMVPKYSLPNAVSLNKALQLGRLREHTKIDAAAQDVAILQYTGGTTGVAKGAMLTHRNLIANMLQAGPILDSIADLPANATLIAPLPLYHIYAFTVHSMASFSLGHHSVLIPNPRDIAGFIKTLQQTEFNIFVGLNTLFVGLMKAPGFTDIDFTQLKMTLSGGMALTASTVKRWQELTGSNINEGYGMTETAPVITMNPIGAVKLGTVGIPVASTTVKVVDEEGADLPIGEAGELCVKGPQVMKGYWQRPEATTEIMTEDGWLRTGDMAVIEEDGYVRLVDRKKDMIIVSGFNVYPSEVENILSDHENIVECAVIGVPDETSGEVVKAFVVSSADLTVDAVRDFCRDRMTAYKVPKFVEFRDDLPKSNVGKVLRRELRDAELKQQN